ncbi:MAG: cyclase [Actinomycetota bacterium]|nr:cyclase [Actinomycetota bacterium]
MAIGRITVDRDAAAVTAVLADLPAMVEWTAAESVDVIASDDRGRPNVARWRERYGPLRDDFVLSYDWHDDGVSWTLTEGRILTTEDGRYTLGPAPGGGTAVVYSVRLGLALWLPRLVLSRIESFVVDSTLAALKRRVEQS